MNLHLVFIVAALVCFILAALNVNVPKLNLLATGLALLTIAFAFV